MIIWSTAKSSILTQNGIKKIKNSIRNFGTTVISIADFFSPPNDDIDTLIKEILDFCGTFNILLFIDNLETILDKRIRDFIREIQNIAKVIITSRIGLGELEFPRKITGFSEAESITFIREIATVRNTTILKKLPNIKLIEFSKKLYFNPLALKWFANSVESGRTPEEIVNNKDDLLNFCLSNVYEKISSNSRLILKTILASRKKLSEAMIIYLTSMNPIEVKKTIIELLTSSFVNRDYTIMNGSREIQYFVSEFTKDYILKNYPPKKEFVKSIVSKLHQLQSSFEDSQRLKRIAKFEVNSICIENENEILVANMLYEALKLSRKKEYNLALQKISRAKETLPSYPEVYRISAFIKVLNSEILSAEEDYKIGLDIDSENEQLLYFYSGFLLRELDDVESALKVAKQLMNRNKSTSPTLLYSRCLTYQGMYKESAELLKLIRNESNNSSKTRKIIYS